jgi:hypothetical protein
VHEAFTLESRGTTDNIKERLEDTKKYLLSKIDLMHVLEDKVREVENKIDKVHD